VRGNDQTPESLALLALICKASRTENWVPWSMCGIHSQALDCFRSTRKGHILCFAIA
jgi:hypothetical protein